MKMAKVLLLAAWLASGCGAAHAATTCTFGTIAGMSIANYVEGVAATPQPMSVVVNCNRAAHPADPSSVTYTVTFDTGNNTNRAIVNVSGTNYYITYSKGTATTCTPALTTSSGTFTWSGATKTGLKTATVSFYGCVGAQTGVAAGTHTDSIGVTLTDNLGNAPVVSSVPVSITVPPVCTVTTPPTLTFNYAAFRASALVVPAGFNVTCTNTAPYTVSLDTSAGVAAGLAYTLALSSPSGTGNGLAQPFTVTGTMAANQPGDCTSSCSQTNVHTLTVTY